MNVNDEGKCLDMTKYFVQVVQSEYMKRIKQPRNV